jgi:MORN repeat
MKTFLSFIAALFFFNFVTAQDCEVKLLPLNGKYEGGCKDGKANGIGKATGLDSYEGNFKNGYPEGDGTYTWSVGDSFKGGFKKGLKSGKGEMHFKRKNMEDSVVTGFWSKDVYKGKYEEPYKFFEVSNAVSQKSVNRMGTKMNTVTVTMISGMFGSANVRAYQLLEGNFIRTNFRDGNKTEIVEFQGVNFPFRIRFTQDKGPIDVIFYEDGEWNLELVL